MIREAKKSCPRVKITLLCRAAGIKRSSYYAFLKSSPKRIEKDQRSLDLLIPIFEKMNRKAGIVMLDMLLRTKGTIFNHKKIARLKREYGLVTEIRQRDPYKDIPKSSAEHATIPNLIQRDFYPPLPHMVYATDMTYLFYGNCEKAYLSAIKDLATNEVVSFRLFKKPAVGCFVNQVREYFCLTDNSSEEVILHSDQGFQYTHDSMQATLCELGIRQSMSRRGNCLDNAAMETFFGHFKDMIDVKKCRSFEEVEKEIEEKMRFYNQERPQKALNKKPPVEYRGLLSGFF